MRHTAIHPALRRGERAPLYPRVCSEQALVEAWRSVRRGGNGAGSDGQTVAVFEARWPEYMAELQGQLLDRSYQPLPPRVYELPKRDGGSRTIDLPAVRDRVVQRAVYDLVHPLFSRAASPAAFGALPGRGVGQALARVEHARGQGLAWAAHSDFVDFFGQVDRARIVRTFRQVTGDDPLAALVEAWLAIGMLRPDGPTQPVAAVDPHGDDEPAEAVSAGLLGRLRGGIAQAQELEGELPAGMLLRPLAETVATRAGAALLRRRGGGRAALVMLGLGAAATAGGIALSATRRRTTAAGPPLQRGTPQGSPLSPLLATSILTPFDTALDRHGRVLTRYVDDFTVVCRDEGAAAVALAEAEEQAERLGLRLHPDKTGLQPYDLGFIFLGTSLPQLPPAGPGATARRTAVESFRRAGYWRTRLAARTRGGRSERHGGAS